MSTMNASHSTLVCQLNQLGVSKLVKGSESEAAEYFFRALVACKYSASTDTLALHLESSTTSGPKTESISSTRSGIDAEAQTATTATATAPAAAPMDPNPNDIDEGMDVYQDALHLTNDLNDSRTQATILHYNISQAFVRCGKYATAQQWLDRAVELVATDADNADTTLQFRLWHAMGYCLYRQCNVVGALSAYQKAMTLSLSLGAPHMATTQNCLGVVLFLSLHHNHADDQPAIIESALTLFQSALAVYELVFGPESNRVATILNNIGRARCYQTNYQSALPIYERAWAIRRVHHQELDDADIESSSTLDLATSVCNLAQTYHHCGELDLALLHYFEFLELVESPMALGPEDNPRSRQHHRDVAVIYTYMAEIHIHQGDLEEAKTSFRSALSISQAVHGASAMHHDLAMLLYKLGNVHYQLKEFDDALHCYNQGLHIDQTVLAWNDPQISAALLNVAQIQRVLQQFGDAMISYSRLHSIQVGTHGADSLEVAATLSVMGLLQYQTNNYASSFDLYLQALQIQRTLYGEDTDENCDIAWTMSSLGLVLFHQGAFALSQRCFADSLRMRQRILGPDHGENAVLCYNLATICLKGGDEETAVEYYQETIRLERIHAKGVDGSSHAHMLVLHLGHLAVLYQRRGDYDRAIACYTEAVELERTKPGVTHDSQTHQSIGRLHNLMGNLYLQTGQVDSMMKHYEAASRIFQNLGDPHETVDLVGLNLYLLSKLLPPCAAVA